MGTGARVQEDRPSAAPAGIRVWHVAGFEGLCFYRGIDVSHPYPRHWHDELHLCAYTAGSGYAAYRGCSQRFSSGDFTVTPAGEVHSNWVAKGEAVSFRSAYVDTRLLRERSRQITGGHDRVPDFPSVVLRDALLKQSFLRAHCAMETSAPHLEREEALLQFFFRLITRCSDVRGGTGRTGHERAVVRRTRDFIDEYFAESISLFHLASLAELSPFHLHTVFCRETGMPPHAYQTQVRINRAKELLRRGRPLAEIALATGFADQSHFARHFRRLVGVTPGRFGVERKNVQDGA